MIDSTILEPLRQVRGGATVVVSRNEGSPELYATRKRGKELAEALGSNNAVFIRNHGVVFDGVIVIDMVKRGIELESTCRQTLAANGSGFAWSWPGDEEMARKSADYGSRNGDDALWDHYCRVLERAEANGDVRLSIALISAS